MILCRECNHPLEMCETGYLCPSCKFRYPKKDGIVLFSRVINNAESFFSKETFENVFASEMTSFWYNVRNTIICQTISHYLLKTNRVIEVGSGTGYVASAIRNMGYSVDCADLSFDALSFCQTRNAGQSYFLLNMEDAIFIEEYDAVCAFDIIEHMEHDNVALKNMHRMLKPGGVLFITVPACRSLWSIGDEVAEHKRRYSHKELQESIEREGFQVCRITCFMSLLFPMYFVLTKISIFLSFKRYTKEKRREKWFSQFNPSPTLNFFLYHIFNIEPLLLRYINLPLGSSLMCVARKNGKSNQNNAPKYDAGT